MTLLNKTSILESGTYIIFSGTSFCHKSTFKGMCGSYYGVVMQNNYEMCVMCGKKNQFITPSHMFRIATEEEIIEIKKIAKYQVIEL